VAWRRREGARAEQRDEALSGEEVEKPARGCRTNRLRDLALTRFAERSRTCKQPCGRLLRLPCAGSTGYEKVRSFFGVCTGKDLSVNSPSDWAAVNSTRLP
jgi:hypothetical protein